MITFRFIIIRTNQLIPNSTMFYCWRLQVGIGQSCLETTGTLIFWLSVCKRHQDPTLPRNWSKLSKRLTGQEFPNSNIIIVKYLKKKNNYVNNIFVLRKQFCRLVGEVIMQSLKLYVFGLKGYMESFTIGRPFNWFFSCVIHY